ncbi:MAG: Crp/Fnr family transcriptional regulator [Tannerellaceae bacterium]|jgi:CRP-like cAMP-binding protein|nr:Crp/Fnr family transcriptional regulator [Tannerellaceae bacterium]
MNTADIVNIITGKYNLQLPLEEVEQLASIIKRNTLAKGEVFLGQGCIAKDFMYVESGMIRQFYYKKGHDITEHFTCEGSTMAFCIVSLFGGSPTELMVEALEPSVVYTMPNENLKTLSYQFPGIAGLRFAILESALVLSQLKADSWRFETARERYERFVKDYPEVARRASVNHVASYLLMAPESLSRIRAGVL